LSGRRWLFILAPLLALALVAEGRAAMERWRASRILRAVETVSLQASQRGGLPRRIADHHLRLLDEAGELDPALVDVPVARGWQYLLTGRPEGAIRAFAEALELEPRARVWANLGEAQLQAGHHVEAREAFAAAIALDPLLERELRGQLARLQAP
jgi:tetratricopeptide (TPR) repeat protein